MSDKKPQLWAMYWTCGDGGDEAIYAFWFTPTENQEMPDLDKSLSLLGLDYEDGDEGGGVLCRVDEDGADFKTYQH